ncbi:MAG: hypothetical protein GY895_06280 [Phycisphaera sp.]|nr:hypothetical protein [Phycisphaera sp.]
MFRDLFGERTSDDDADTADRGTLEGGPPRDSSVWILLHVEPPRGGRCRKEVGTASDRLPDRIEPVSFAASYPVAHCIDVRSGFAAVGLLGLAADAVVAGAPIHNFDVPSQMKAWGDQIVRARRTFGSMTTCSTPCYNRRRSDVG